ASLLLAEERLVALGVLEHLRRDVGDAFRLDQPPAELPAAALGQFLRLPERLAATLQSARPLLFRFRAGVEVTVQLAGRRRVAGALVEGQRRRQVAAERRVAGRPLGQT